MTPYGEIVAMKLHDHLMKLSREQRAEVAAKCGTSLGHLTNVSYGYKTCGPALAVAIEKATAGEVTRKDLRPKDWRAVWPELMKPVNLQGA